MNFKEDFFNAAISKNGYCGYCDGIYTSENVIKQLHQRKKIDCMSSLKIASRTFWHLRRMISLRETCYDMCDFTTHYYV